jgi:hypothetical protein
VRTVIIIVGGLALLGLAMLAGCLTPLGASRVALWFIPLWLLLAAANLWIGTTRAGYSVGEELPIFLVIFAIPVVAAFVAWRKFSGD